MSERSTIMVHEISDFVVGQLEDLKIQIKEAQRLEGILNNIYVTRTNKKKKEYWQSLKRDTYFGPQQAVELGFVHEIVEEHAGE